jgi:hypothetical protein
MIKGYLASVPPGSVRVLHRVPAAVGHVPQPFSGHILAVFLLTLEVDHPVFAVPGYTLGIHRGPVVNDAAVHRPAPGEFREKADVVCRVLLPAAGGHVAFFRIAVAVQPVARRGGPVGLEKSETGHQGALFEGFAFDGDILHKIAVDLPGHLVRIVCAIGFVVPFQVANRFGKNAPILVYRFDLLSQCQDDVAVRQAVSQRFGPLVAPLHPAAAVGDAALLFHRYTGRQHEDFGLDGRRIHAGPCQNDPVSLSNRLTLTIQSSLPMASRVLLALAPLQAGFWPQAKKPLIFSLYMASKRSNQE